jgi:hypothetical protein
MNQARTLFDAETATPAGLSRRVGELDRAIGEGPGLAQQAQCGEGCPAGPERNAFAEEEGQEDYLQALEPARIVKGADGLRAAHEMDIAVGAPRPGLPEQARRAALGGHHMLRDGAWVARSGIVRLMGASESPD